MPLLIDVVFIPHGSFSKDELEARKAQAFNELEGTIPRLVTKILGPGIQNGSRTLLEILQNPHYNKQVDYFIFVAVVIVI